MVLEDSQQRWHEKKGTSAEFSNFCQLFLIICCSLLFCLQKIETLEHRMYTHPLHKDSSLESLYSLCEQKATVSLFRLCSLLYRVQRKSFLQLAIRASWSYHLLAQTSFQLAPKTFWLAELISQFFCYSNSSNNITCPSGKLKTEFTSPIVKFTNPGLSDTTFFARCCIIILYTSNGASFLPMPLIAHFMFANNVTGVLLVH